MNLKAAAILLILLSFAVQSSREAAAAETALPPTLAKALEGAELDTQDGWAFRQTVILNVPDEVGTTEITRWDPSRPEGEQCTVVSVTRSDGKASKSDPCEEGHERETYGEMVKELHGATFQTVSEDDERAVYSFVPTGDDQTLDVEGVDIGIDADSAKHLVGTVEVVKTGPGAPYVERFAMKLKEPAGNLLARLKDLNVVYQYAPDADTGAKLLRGVDVELHMSVFMMFNAAVDVSMRFDEYRKL
jgi:hypothetical protein